MDLLDLQDRVILITGGCGSIGRVIVRELTAHNARVARRGWWHAQNHHYATLQLAVCRFASL